MNPLKQKLERGELTASMTVRLVSSVENIELEHSPLSIETTSQISVMAP